MKHYVFFALLMIYVTSTRAQDFAPGSDDINEQQILRQIESEIGLRDATSQEVKTQRASEQTTLNKQEQRAFLITVQAGEENPEISGATHFFQDSLILRDIKGEGIRSIKITDIRKLIIKSWTPSIALEVNNNEYTVLFLPYICSVELNSSPPLEGIIDGENWIQIVIRDGGEKRPIPLSYSVTIKASSREEALKAARKNQSMVPSGHYSSVVFKETQINEVSSTNKQ